MEGCERTEETGNLWLSKVVLEMKEHHSLREETGDKRKQKKIGNKGDGNDVETAKGLKKKKTWSQ